ncbi:YlbE family protein [Thalassiella azotivora]
MSTQHAGAESARTVLSAPERVVTVGVDLFADALAAQSVTVDRVEWRPPLGGHDDAVMRVLADPRREEANRLALSRVLATGAVLVDVRPASEALGLEPGTFLHAGPPLTWERASGPMRGALIGAMLFEGLADTPEEAERLLADGQLRDGTSITLDPCHHHAAVGPMAGVVSPSMWVFQVSDPASGRSTYCSLNEGLGKVLRYGAYGPEVVERLHWMSRVLGPLLQQAVRRRAASDAGPIDIRSITAQMLQMGDEGHNRNRAGTMMLVRELVPELLELGADAGDVADVVRFCNGNDHFYLNLVMPACKLMLDAGRDVPGSTLVTVMARNGTDFGIQVSGTGDRWFTGPAQVPDGLFLGDYGPDDANPDIGDSAITETAGIGGFSMAAAPAIVAFVGGDSTTAMSTTRRMYEITLGEHPVFQIPILGFRGSPVGIDVVQVVRTGVLPQINTGMAGKVAGTGQVGAGLVNPPAECFAEAVRALAEAAG